MNRSRTIVVIAVIAAVVAVVVICGLRSSDGDRKSPLAESSSPSAAETVTSSQPEAAPRPSAVTNAVRQAGKSSEEIWAEKLGSNRVAAAAAKLAQQAAEREMTEAEFAAVQMAHDMAAARNAEAARRFAGQQLNAAHPKVREAAVFALANCGEPCLAELTPFLADADEGVRTEALTAWSSEWFSMPNGELKTGAAVAVMCVLNDEQALAPIADELMKLPRKDADAALSTVVEEGSDAGKAVARRTREALGLK